MAHEESALKDLRVEKDDLFLEETFTDLRVGTVRRLTPVTANGDADPGREVLYFGQAQVLSQLGPLPIQFAIEASSLEEALDRFPENAEEALAKMIEEIRELQRQQASQIVVPGMGGHGGPAGPGGMPPLNPTGRFQLR